jgi:unsaturated rhamnogalacturonyl hydrolase
MSLHIFSPLSAAYYSILAAVFSVGLCYGNGGDKVVFTVQRNYRPLPQQEKASVAVDWQDVVKRFPAAQSLDFDVTEMNFGRKVNIFVADINNDGKQDKLVLDIEFTSNEPIYTFTLATASAKVGMAPMPAVQSDKYIVTFLTAYPDFVKKGNKVASWSDKIIESTMQFYPDPSGISINAPGQWNYEYGFYLNAAFVRWQQTRNEKYYNYIKRWADRFIDNEGNLNKEQYRVEEYKLDDILPGRLFLSLYEVTHEEKYRKAADILADHLRHQPKTSDGGYWHKQVYPYQMWLDGIYMGDVFSTQYATVFKKPEFIDEAIHQIKLISQHTKDPVTGLMYHGWDESKNNVWADPEKGTSPEFWGRAIGWYIMAVVECLDYIPENHPERKDVIKILQDLAKSLAAYQDVKTHLWYQVLNKQQQPGNWIEASCSGMFAYGFAKGARKGYLDKTYRDKAQQAFDALKQQYIYFDDNGRLYLEQTVKVGTLNLKVSKGDFDYYVATERRINDYKGLGALLYASLELK